MSPGTSSELYFQRENFGVYIGRESENCYIDHRERSIFPQSENTAAGRSHSFYQPAFIAVPGYDSIAFSVELRGNSVRPFIKHCIYSSLDNARMASDRYHQRLCLKPFARRSSARSCSSVRARSWLEFREMVLKATVYNRRRRVRLW